MLRLTAIASSSLCGGVVLLRFANFSRASVNGITAGLFRISKRRFFC
jgi:hypothetical protein